MGYTFLSFVVMSNALLCSAWLYNTEVLHIGLNNFSPSITRSTKEFS